MKSFFPPILSLMVCSVMLFGPTECALSEIMPSPAAVTKNITSFMSMHGPNTTILNVSTAFVTHSPNASTVHVTTAMPNVTSAFTTVPNKTIISSVLPNHTSIISITSHPINSSIHHSSIYVTLSSVIMSSSAGNGTIHNSTIHPTPLPTHSINMSSTVVHNASSHILSTMTPSPSPKTSVLPSSSMVPTPQPLPKGKYSVKKNGTACLLLWLSLKFTISYKNSSGNKLDSKNIEMPSTGKASGFCEQSLSSIRISWPYYTFEAFFITTVKNVKDANANQGHWITRNVTITAQTINNTDFDNAKDAIIQQSVTTQGKLEWLSGHLGKSLNCSVDKVLKTDNMTADVEWLRIQPFEVHNGFAEADSCTGTPTPTPTGTPKKSKSSTNTVAIAVGCSLAGLVLIVLIGYFIGKRRSRAGPGTGYRKL